MQRVLVTGSTGFIGGALAHRVLADGVKTRLLVRDRRRLEGTALETAEVIEGDITDPDALRRATADIDIVYSIAGTFREPDLSDADYRRVNVDSVRHTIAAAGENGVKRVVHCSTCGIHGNIDAGQMAAESDPVRPVGIYEITKAEGDRVALELGDKSGVEVSVIRPTPVYGPGDTRLLKLFKLVNRDRVVLLGPGTAAYQLVYIDDLVDAFLFAGNRSEAVGEAFLVGGAEIPALNELVHVLANILEKQQQKIIHLPARPVWLLSWLCESICRPFGISPPLFPRRVEFFTNNRAFDISKARELLGFDPQVSLEEGLQKTLAWYRSQALI